MIDSAEALEPVVRAGLASPSIAVDAEGDGLYRYRARLCTLQIAAGATIAVVDTLAVTDRARLAALLGPSGPEKILHDAAFDARLLAQEGVTLGHVFDTAAAARFLGEVSTGLSSLLAAVLGVHVEKDLQQADWGKRPLDEASVAYLEEDVRHLGALAEALRERCAAAGILEEVRIESAYGARAPREADVLPWTRVKGAGELRRGTERAILREVALVRERFAEADDVPPFRVLPNALLLALARRGLEGSQGSQGSQGSVLGRVRRRELSEALREAIARGAEAGEVPAEELAVFRPPPPPPAEREAQKKRERALLAWRARASEERGVGLQVVLPGHCLRALAARGALDAEELAGIEGLGACRLERYGAALVAVLAGA